MNLNKLEDFLLDSKDAEFNSIIQVINEIHIGLKGSQINLFIKRLDSQFILLISDLFLIKNVYNGVVNFDVVDHAKYETWAKVIKSKSSQSSQDF
ncbi:hypothetical protein BpHYR1_014803 [Brachionus plicatilis]|uniref:Uncharacterized protein n=1 Tax=Brachionus plicatilis TaxID=10195 RepID=A0A3M7P2Y1_BRAPC|nr:hypothetical protein BpHYR1_014803 [Brachionus plicatilis]